MTVLATAGILHAKPHLDAGNWIPIRWWDASARSLALLENSPINCLVLPESIRTDELIREARRRKLAVLALASSLEEARRVNLAGFDGVVLEGEFAGGFDAHPPAFT